MTSETESSRSRVDLQHPAQPSSDERYRIAFEASMDAMLLTAPGGEILAANPAACAMFGWTEAEMQQLGRSELVDITDPRLAPALQTRARTGSFRGELTFRRKNGGTFPGEVSSTLFRDQNGALRSSLFIHDITTRKAAEAQQTYLTTLLANVPAAVISTDGEFRIRTWNQYAETMYGWSAQEAVGCTIDEICQTSVTYGATAAKLRSLLGDAGVWHGELEHQHRSGRPLYVHAHVSVMRTQQGDIAGSIAINVDITERKGAEQALAASERQFRALFENMILGVVYHEADGRISLANQAAQQILGLTLDQMQGRTSIDPRWQAVREDGSNFPGEEHPAMVALRTGQIVTDVLMGVHHPLREEHRWIRIAAVPEFGPGEPAPLRVFVTFDDITERRRAEQALATSEARYRQAISAAGAIPYVLDYTTNRYDFVQHDIEAFTGYAATELTPEHMAEIWVTSIPRGRYAGLSMQEAVARACGSQDNHPWECDHCVRDRSGKERWFSDVAIQILDEEGAPKGAIGILQEITERKRAEESLRASEERYRQSAAELEQRIVARTLELQAERDFANQMMEALGQGLVVSDIRGQIIYVNPAMERLLDAPPLALIGRTLADFAHPDALPMISDLFPRRRFDEEFQFELRLCTVTGQSKYVLISTTPRWQNGEVIGRIALFTDLTHLKEIEATLRQSRDELRASNAALERALRLKDEFLASMSHELRTPLTGILGLSEALQMQTFGALNEWQLRSVTTIWESGRHLLTLINDILDLSKLAAAQLDLDFELCDVLDLGESSLSLVKGMAHKKQQSVALTISPPEMSVEADPRRMKQMLVNLLSNAVKFTPAGGKLGLHIQGDPIRQVIEFSVWDCGIGIAEENLERVFQPFTQLDGGLAREYAGTGLGLTLVQRMIEYHGGQITVTSTLGVGSTFTLALPWRQAVPSAASTQVEADLATDSATDSAQIPRDATPAPGHARLLLAEDDPINADMLCEYLEINGYTLVLAEDGLEAVQKAATLRPDLILMDVQMPQLDGLQAIQQIRRSADPALAATPIIVLTAQAMYGDADRCLAAGANMYISKPFRAADVLRAVQSYLQGEHPTAPAAG